jgi:hypothetical protein
VGKGSIEVHSPKLLGDQVVGGLLSLGPFGHGIYQGLGLDHRLGYVGYVKSHKLECPFGDPSRGESVPDNFSEPGQGYHPYWVALKIMQELAHRD